MDGWAPSWPGDDVTTRERDGKELNPHFFVITTTSFIVRKFRSDRDPSTTLTSCSDARGAHRSRFPSTNPSFSISLTLVWCTSGFVIHSFVPICAIYYAEGSQWLTIFYAPYCGVRGSSTGCRGESPSPFPTHQRSSLFTLLSNPLPHRVTALLITLI